MNNHPQSGLTQILTAGVQEVMGEGELHRLIQRTPNAAQSFESVREVQIALEQAYGFNSGRGVLLRSGRACFRHLLPGFWARLGMTNLQYRLNPTPVRIRLGLRALAALLGQMLGVEVVFEETSASWLWRMVTCPFCDERKSSGPTCDFAVGVLQEFLSWTSSGRFYLVEEVECLGAGGSACTFRVLKKPLD